jgi:hydroxymethylbilane synthase
VPDPSGRLRVGTRGSALALWQTDHVVARMRAAVSAPDVERVVLTTTGDRVLDTPLARIGEKGLFTAELEAALRSGEIDLAVHSLKDLPTAAPDGLVIGAILEREDPRDALVAPAETTLASLRRGAVVGTSSLRRRAQLLALRPDLRVLDLRGNVPTRIEKLLRGDYDAVVLARAGLVRLGLTEHIAAVISPDLMLPAVGQGAIAVQMRADDPVTGAAISALDHGPTRLATAAERALLAELEGGCQVPLGALARLDGPTLTMDAVVADLDGRDIVRQNGRASVENTAAAERLGREVAARIIQQGGRAILERVRTANAPPVDTRS